MTNIFVGNLAYQTNNEDLQAAFSQYGAVEKATVVYDRDSGQSRGFGFVEMTNAQEASQAISGLNGRDLNGRTLTVNEAKERGSQPRSGGKQRW